MTLNFAIGKNTTEGKTHMMCIEGTEGERLFFHMRLCVMLNSLCRIFVKCRADADEGILTNCS